MFKWIFTRNHDNREEVIRNSLRHLLIYIPFVLIVSLVIYCVLSPMQFTFTKVLQAQFLDIQFETTNNAYITFSDIQTVNDFWTYLKNVLCSNLYGDEDNGDNYKVLNENELIGVPRLRQLRVRNDSCQVHETFVRTFVACYDAYSKSTESEFSFGPGDSDAWHYHPPNSYHYYWGLLAVYDNGGFYQDLTRAKKTSMEIIKDLEENLWINRESRAVFLDFTLYNANVNLFCVIKLVFEFPTTGGILTSSTFRTVTLIRYVRTSDYFALGCELVFIGFILYYGTLEVYEATKIGPVPYLKSGWNYIDLLIVMISAICISFNLYCLITFNVKTTATTVYDSSLESAAFWRIQYNNALAVTLFILWIKIFKYVNVSRIMGQLSETLARCAMDIIHFSVMFLIVFIAFAQVGYLLFGSEVERFSTFGNSVLSLLMTILGDFDYYEIERTNKILAPIFFITYIFIVFFVLFNMFLAIITDTYSDIKDEIKMKKSELEVVDFVKRAPWNFIQKIRKHGPSSKPKRLNELIESVRNILKLCKFTDSEIHIFFSTYNINIDGDVNENDLNKFLKELKHFRTTNGKGQQTKSIFTPQIMQVQQERLNQIENQLLSLQAKVNTLIKMTHKIE